MNRVKIGVVTKFISLFTLFGFHGFGQVDQLLQEGVTLHDQGNYQAALGKYEEVLKENPDHLIALAEKAFSLFYLQEFQESAETCKHAIDKNPKSHDLKTVYVTYGNALDALKKTEEAVQVYNQGIDLFPDYYQLFFNKGVTLTNMNNLPKALKAFEHSLSINPDHASSHNAVGRLALMDNMKVPALLAFGRFFTLEPDGARNTSNKKHLDEILKADVKQNGKHKITIEIDPSELGANREQKENDFSSVELILKMSAAEDFNKKNRKESEADRFIRKFKNICSAMEKMQGYNYGFFWEYYGPYYIEMNREEMIKPYAHYVYAHYQEGNSKKWIEVHPEEMKAFGEWSKSYDWYGN